MKLETNSLIEQGEKEVLNPFPIMKDLVAFAKGNLAETSYSIYTDPVWRKDGQKAVELPDKFAPFVAGYPGKYFVVFYEDRFGTYYAPGTRMRQVGLSTSQHRYESNEILREINVIEPDPSEGKGNVIFLTVSDLVNEKSLLDLNTAKGLAVDQPHGSAKIMYEIDVSGSKRIKESHFSRLDEAVFSWRNEQRPVRWVRNLDIENLPEQTFHIVYEDYYLIGRDENSLTEERTKARTSIEEEAGSFQSVLIEIGIGSLDSARTIFESQDKTIRVVEHSPAGMKAYRNQMEIIKQDPNYSFIFEQPVDPTKVINFMKAKIKMLENDWNKWQTVFGNNQIEDYSGKLIV